MRDTPAAWRRNRILLLGCAFVLFALCVPVARSLVSWSGAAPHSQAKYLPTQSTANTVEDDFSGRASGTGLGTSSNPDGLTNVAWKYDGDGTKSYVTIDGSNYWGVYGYQGTINQVGNATAGLTTYSGGDSLVEYQLTAVGHGAFYLTQNACASKTCWYAAKLNTNANTESIIYRSGSANTTEASVSKTLSATTWYYTRLRVQDTGSGGYTVAARTWAVSATEPTTWDVTWTDTSQLAAGYQGFGATWPAAGTGEAIDIMGYAFASGSAVATLTNRAQNRLGVKFACSSVATNIHLLTTSGRNIQNNGSTLKLYGGTTYMASYSNISEWWTATSTFDPVFDSYRNLLLNAGQNLVRNTDFWSPTSSSNPAWDNDTLWQNLDYAVCSSAQHGIWTHFDLSSWGHWLNQQGYTEWDSTNWAVFEYWVAHHFADTPAIAYYSIEGEPAYPTSSAQETALNTFYTNTLSYLHDNDSSHHLLAEGGFNHMEASYGYNGETWWKDLWGLSNNNLLTFKDYSNNDNNLLPDEDTEATTLSKPLVLEEFGVPQSLGDHVYTGNAWNGITVARDSDYTTIYGFVSGHSLAGIELWNFDCSYVNPATEATGTVGPYDVGSESGVSYTWGVVATNAPNATVAPATPIC